MPFGSYQHVAVDKVTDKTPVVIKVPSKHFRAVNLEVEGKDNSHIDADIETSKKQQEAWAKFLSVYGYPKLANTKGDLFVSKSTNRPEVHSTEGC